MKYSRKDEAALMERILATKDDPVLFARIAYPWGQAHTPLANVKGLRKWQEEELEAMAAHVAGAVEAHGLGLPSPIYRAAYSSGRGPGKSALFGIAAHWHVSTHWGAQTIVAANTETQLRTKTFPEIARWVNMAANSHWFTVEGLRILPAPWFTDAVLEQRKIDPRYWTIQGQTWTEEAPDAFAGAHNQIGLIVLFDEAAGIPPGVWDTADGFFTDPGPYRAILAASQMRRASGRFYDLFHNAQLGQGWRLRTLDIRGMEGVDQEWVRGFIARHGINSDTVRIEILGKAPSQGESQLIGHDLVEGARERQIPEGFNYGEPLIMGVDPAPRGRTVIRFRQGRNARDCCGRDTVTVLEGADNKGIADTVAELSRKYDVDAIAVDFGMGTGVIDNLKHDHKIRVTEVRFGAPPSDKDSEWGTEGAELWVAIRDWLPGGMVDMSDDLRTELTVREWVWLSKEDGKKGLEQKSKLKARGYPSPDHADALACTFKPKPPRRTSRLGAKRETKIAEGTSTWMA